MSHGQRVIVTGAGSGIGRATALGFARAGASLAVLGMHADALAQTCHLAQAAGAIAHPICTDISDEDSVQHAFATAARLLGGIDVAVNNAGISQPPAATADIPQAEWQRVIDVNLTGTWLCLREALRRIAPHAGGAIVNIASFAGLRTMPMQSAYVASKHAIVGLTSNAAVEYAPHGIRVNAVAPGGITTPMMEATLAGLDAEQRAGAMAQIAAFHPLKRPGSAEEIADAVLFLCSDKAAFITGACLSVDGGWSAA